MNKRKRLFIMIAVVLAFCVQVCFSQELIENAGFESGFAAWQMWGDGDLREEYYGVLPHMGTSCLRLWLRSGWYQDFSVKSGDALNVSAWVATAAKDAVWGDAYGEVKIEWRNKDGEDREAGEATSIKFDVIGKQDRTIRADIWTQIELPRVIAPAKATHGRVLLTIWSSDDKGGGCALFDDVSVQKSRP